MVKTGLPLVPSPFKGLSALLPSGVLGVPVPCPILPTVSMRSFSFPPIPKRICFEDSALIPRSVELPVLKSDVALPIYEKVVPPV